VLVDDIIAGVELGGTKAVAVLARGQTILGKTQIPTTNPKDTLGALRAQLAQWQSGSGFSALGIGSFGPLRVGSEYADYGSILSTPKPGWSGVNVAQELTAGLGRPWMIDTDVNGAALAEAWWGAGQGVKSLCYITIGTGIGGGFLIRGMPIHGALHPEIGHLRLGCQHEDRFLGICPFHGNCVEGLFSGAALKARFGVPAEQVSVDDPRWPPIISGLAELFATIILMASPQKILVGGGVGLGLPFLVERARDSVPGLLGGYLPTITEETIRSVIASPGLGANAGPLGAIALGKLALDEARSKVRKES